MPSIPAIRRDRPAGRFVPTKRWPWLRAEAAATLLLAGPLIIHNLALVGMSLTDTIMAGLLGSKVLAAVAVGSNLWAPVFLFALGVLMAQSPTTAHLHGAGKNREIGDYARQMAWLSQALGWGGFMLLRHSAPFMRMIHIEADIIPGASAYLRALAWGLPGVCLYQTLRFTSEGIGHTRPMLAMATLGLMVNGVLDYLLMYGKLGLPALGAVGCGYATAASQWLMFLALLLYMRRRPLYRPLEIFRRFEWPRWAPQRELIWLGVPIGIGIFMESSLFAGVGLMMGTLGTNTVAAHQIALNYASFVFMVPMSIAFAISVRVGQALGRGDPHAARLAGFAGIGVCACFELLSALSMLLFPDWIVGVYTHDAGVARIAVGLLYIGAVFQLSDGLQTSAAGALRGYKDTRMPMLITIVAYWLVGFPLAWLFGVPLHLGPQMIWVGFIAGLTVAAVLLMRRFMLLSRSPSRTAASI
ncbi:MAG: MATE family efflux transporter [Gammaproteobacteria bacterium]|nr:MATE family efflux transporter [Gammaproteobacteria bacterium]MDE2346808.1 MATE family efflux transporter [Gammaproteobacteria bacterium]